MSDFLAAATALQAATTAAGLWPPFCAALPVADVGISTLGAPFGSETIAASSDTAVQLEELQLDLGEGPAWEAHRTQQPVLAPGLTTARAAHWPVALHALQARGVRSVFAFPMRVGTLAIGAVDLYSTSDTTLPEGAVRDAITLTAIAARHVLQFALTAAETGNDAVAGQYSRREIHQATGMVAAQQVVTVTDAALILLGHAFTAGRTVRDVALDVINRYLDFTTPDTT